MHHPAPRPKTKEIQYGELGVSTRQPPESDNSQPPTRRKRNTLNYRTVARPANENAAKACWSRVLKDGRAATTLLNGNWSTIDDSARASTFHSIQGIAETPLNDSASGGVRRGFHGVRRRRPTAAGSAGPALCGVPLCCCEPFCGRCRDSPRSPRC